MLFSLLPDHQAGIGGGRVCATEFYESSWGLHAPHVPALLGQVDV